ncbi:MAG: hypothetical protein IPK12_04490 [Gemmatimonadetes bacterium]|nr:hypothetical protein [Gemmatimonadota bacterium]
MRSPIRRLVALVLVAAHAVFAVAPMLHRCEHGGARRGAADVPHSAMAGHAGHHMPAGPSAPVPGPSPARCDCVDHACCAGMGALPAPIVLAIRTVIAVRAAAAAPVPAPPVARLDRRLPLAQAPPAPPA